MNKEISKKLTRKSKRNKPIFWRNLFYETVYRAIDTPLPEIAFISAFIMSRWWLNSDFSYPAEILFPIIVFGLVGSVAYYGYRAVFGKGSAAHLAAILLTYCFYGYSFVLETWVGLHFVKIIPSKFRTDLTQSIIMAVGLIFLAGAIAWIIRKLIVRFTFLKDLQAYKVIIFAVAFIFVIQVVRCGERYIKIHKELSYNYPSAKVKKPAGTSTSPKPDIYFLMPEDYASAQTLQNVNNYDNTKILDYLNREGFVNQQPVYYSNYPFTMSSLASNLAMDYFPKFEQKFSGSDWQTAFPYRSVIKNPPIAQALKQNGYKYNQISSWWDFTRLGINADTNPTKGYQIDFFGLKYYLSDLNRDILNKSIVAPWLKKGISFGSHPILKYEKDYNPKENLSVQIKSIKEIAGRADKSTPQFTFGHFMVPHTPYIFTPDGTEAEYDSEHNDDGAQETLKYSNQVAYFNGQIKDMVSYIRAHDPNAVIMIQSDEGSYPPQFRYEQTKDHYYNPINLPTPEMKQKFSIFASYYMPGIDSATVKQQLDSPVNSFRFVLNSYLGYSLPYLPNCNFATGNKFKVYNYTLVTNKISGSPSPDACKQYQ